MRLIRAFTQLTSQRSLVFSAPLRAPPRIKKVFFAALRGQKSVLRVLPVPGSSLKTKNRLLKTAVPPFPGSSLKTKNRLLKTAVPPSPSPAVD